MHGGPEPLGAPPSFTARRPNASNLPNFELPPPPLSKIHSYGSLNSSAPQPLPHSVASVGNLLTPPSNVPGDGLSPVSTGVTSNSSTSAQGIPPYTPNGYWGSPQTQGQASFNYGQGSAPQQYNQQSRGLYSQGPTPQRGMTYSQPSPKGLPPPPYELNLPSFATSASMSAPAQMPTMSSQQHGVPMHTPVSTGAPHQSPIHAQDQFQHQHRQPPTPTYYQQSAQTPQQSTFPYSTGPSPTQQSPLSAGGTMRMSPANTQGHIPSLHAPAQHSPHPYQRPSYPPYGGLPGPVISNITNPAGGLALHGGMPPNMMPGGFNSGAAAAMGHMYANHQAHQPQAANDRPFKCDQCPQSFNRNHDLKRHKRIHLAVKPFPCGHCDKSFSRKDALKRHILVKGCGKAQASGESKEEDDHGSDTKASSEHHHNNQ